MQSFADLELGNTVLQELYAASNQDRGDADAVAAIWLRVYNQCFVTLFDRGVLESLLVVDEVPSQAQAQLDAMAREVAAHNVEPAEVAAPVTGTGFGRFSKRRFWRSRLRMLDRRLTGAPGRSQLHRSADFSDRQDTFS
jgi:hypothetical protein